MSPSQKKWDSLLQNRKHLGNDPVKRCQNTVTGHYLPWWGRQGQGGVGKERKAREWVGRAGKRRSGCARQSN